MVSWRADVEWFKFHIQFHVKSSVYWGRSFSCILELIFHLYLFIWDAIIMQRLSNFIWINLCTQYILCIKYSLKHAYFHIFIWRNQNNLFNLEIWHQKTFFEFWWSTQDIFLHFKIEKVLCIEWKNNTNIIKDKKH